MELLQWLSGGLISAVALFVVAWIGKERFDAKFQAIEARFGAVDAHGPAGGPYPHFLG
jgi:hypothetical protein